MVNCLMLKTLYRLYLAKGFGQAKYFGQHFIVLAFCYPYRSPDPFQL